MMILATAGTLMLAFAFRVILHHERQWHVRRSVSLNGQRGRFYASPLPPSWFDEGVTT